MTAISPDCRGGDHSACDGVVWDLEQDKETPCTCPHPQHRVSPCGTLVAKAPPLSVRERKGQA